jgi:hypothetical protein
MSGSPSSSSGLASVSRRSSCRLYPETQKKIKKIFVQYLAVVLELVFQLCQLFNDGFAVSDLILFGGVKLADRTVEIINRSCLQMLSNYPPTNQASSYGVTDQNRGPPLSGGDVGE